MAHTWHPLGIDDIRRHLDPTGIDWWIAGGVAIDLFLGWSTRAHDDVDVEMFRSDRGVIHHAFAGWDVHMVSEGERTPWHRGQEIPDDVFGLWLRRGVSAPWSLEILLADGDGTDWRFRRDPRISMPRKQLTRETPSGVTYCAPEVQLLYKAKRARPKDDVDLVRALHRMSSVQKTWVRDALAETDPGHPWIAVLEHATSLTPRSR